MAYLKNKILPMCCLLLLTPLILIGCGNRTGAKKETGSDFPVDAVGDILCDACTPGGGGDGTGSVGPVEEIRGMQFDLDGATFTISESQVNVQNTLAGGIINGSAADETGRVYTLTFTFNSVGKSLPQEYALSVDPQNISGDTAIFSYSEVITNQNSAPNAAQSVANGVFRLEEYNDAAAVGTFSMELALADSTARTITNGQIRMTRNPQ